MNTLSRWRAFLTTPKTLTFPRLELIGQDHALPVIVGTGEVRTCSPNDFEFTLTGVPADIRYALAEINRQRDNPYDGLARFRLVGTDSEGVEWSGGWTTPRLDMDNLVWTFSGEIQALATDDRSPTVCLQSSTELVFLVPPSHRMSLGMTLFADRPGEEPLREHTMEILGSILRFVYDPSINVLSITATHSADLSAPYTENWLGEPLRILFGQLTYPRLVARNFGDGRSSVWVRRSPGLIRHAHWAALWQGDDYRTSKKTAFWSTYAQLLEMIARARGEDGLPNFEAHKVTRLYEEIIQAARASRWVWALTFASSIEGLVKMLTPKDAKPTQADSDAVGVLVKHIKDCSGDARLKQIAINALKRTLENTTIRALRDLRGADVITPEQVSAWEAIRHSVAHGSLVSPYSTQEEDAKLLALAAMMHALTSEILRCSEDSAHMVSAGPNKHATS